MGPMEQLRQLSWRTLSGVIVLTFSMLAICSAHAAEPSRFQALPAPPLTAEAVFVVDATTGTELFAINPDVPLPPASLTKIVSALVILDHANFEDFVTIESGDLVTPEESQVGLAAGDRLSVRELFLGALIPSGNDATLALARHVGTQVLGNEATSEQAVDQFVKLMNEKASELGATQTHLENPTGIDAEGHSMSARDIALLAEAAMQDPQFANVVSMSSAILESEVYPEGYAINTTNELVLEGIADGVKTGTTPNAGGCLVTSFEVGPNEVIAVVLGSDLIESSDGVQDNSARFQDTRTLLNAVQSEYVWLDPAEPGAIAGLEDELQVWDVSLEESVLLPVPASRAEDIRYRLVLDQPGSQEQPAGEVHFFVDDELLSERFAIQMS
jgi:D-alanyl-D-alanine carboxypeptidase (penicillin-binding protein 5/6)